MLNAKPTTLRTPPWPVPAVSGLYFFSFLLFVEHKTLPEFLIHSPDSYYQLITYSIRLYAGLPPSFFGPLRILPLAGPAACFFLMDTSVFPMA